MFEEFGEITTSSGGLICTFEDVYMQDEINLDEKDKNWFNVTTNDRTIRRNRAAVIWSVNLPDTHSRLYWFRFLAEEFLEAQKDGVMFKSEYSKVTKGFPKDSFDNYFVAKDYNEANKAQETRLKEYLPNITKINNTMNRTFRAIELEEFIEDKTFKWYYFEAVALMQLTPLVEKKLHPSTVWFNLATGGANYGDNQVTILLKVCNDDGAHDLIKEEGIISFVNSVKDAWNRASVNDKNIITKEAYKVLGDIIGSSPKELKLSFNYHLVIPTTQLYLPSAEEDVDLSLMGSIIGGGLGL